MDVLSGQLADRNVVDEDPAGVDLVKTHQKVDDGRLAGAGGADDRDLLTRLDIRGKVLDDHSVGVIAELHMLKPHVAPDLIQSAGFMALVGEFFLVEVVEYALGRRGSALHTGEALGELLKRLGEQAHIDGELDDDAVGDKAVFDQYRAYDEYGDKAEVADKGHQGLHQTRQGGGFKDRVAQVAVDTAEFLFGGRFGVVRLDDVVTGVDFLHMAVDRAEVPLLAVKMLLRLAHDH